MPNSSGELKNNNSFIMSYIWAAWWKNQRFAYTKTKKQISCAETAQLISPFVFATWIVQYLLFLSTKLHTSSHLQWLYSLVCVRPGWKPRMFVFSQRSSYKYLYLVNCMWNFLFLQHSSLATPASWYIQWIQRKNYVDLAHKSKDKMSRVMRKPTICICENKDADQLRINREADQRLCFRYLDSTIPLLPKYKISSL